MQGIVKESETPETNEFYFAKQARDLKDKGLAPWFGGIETKSFLENLGRNTYLGGYMDFELRLPGQMKVPLGKPRIPLQVAGTVLIPSDSFDLFLLYTQMFLIGLRLRLNLS